MIITALTQFTATDFPGRLACILFSGGCSLRCGFCHNAEFVLPERLKELTQTIPFENVLAFLKQRKGMLDGVVFCGGEPTINADLLEKMKAVKDLGFQVKLDTNGTNPLMLERALEQGLVDYIAMDLKDALPYREKLVGRLIDADTIKRSIGLVKGSGVEYEFRSTILPSFHDLTTLRQMGHAIRGVDKWVLQGFRNIKTLSGDFNGLAGFENTELQALTKTLAEFAKVVECRPA